MLATITLVCLTVCVAATRDPIDDMQGSMDAWLKNQLMKVLHEQSKMKEELQRNRETISQLQDQVHSLSKIGEEVQLSSDDSQGLPEAKESAPTNVIFNAYSDVKQNAPGLMIFGRVAVNIGGGYNVQTGIFTAPVAGIYHFTANIAKCWEEGTTIRLKKLPDTSLAHQWSSPDAQVGTMATSSIVQLAQGESVGLEIQWGCVDDNDHVYPDSYFMGFLLVKK